MKDVFVIGLDPSAAKTQQSDAAIGVATYKNGVLVDTGELIPDPPYFTRVRNWLRDKYRRITIENGDCEIWLGVETVFLGPNPNIFLGLIQCQSHAVAATLDAGHGVKFVTPLRSFQAATGMSKYRGKGLRKIDIQDALTRSYPQLEGKSEHEFDAAAIAEAVIQDLQK